MSTKKVIKLEKTGGISHSWLVVMRECSYDGLLRGYGEHTQILAGHRDKRKAKEIAKRLKKELGL